MDELIPLSVLRLDLPAPTTGWEADLAARGTPVRLDDLGRPSITREAARRLLAEYRASEARAAERLRRHREEIERQAVERDQEFRAQLHPGLPASMFAEGENPIAVQIAAEKASDPRRRQMQDELWGREFGRSAADEKAYTYHPIRGEDE